MKVYIATSLENAPRHNALRDRLAKHGIELTYDWTVHGSMQTTPDRWPDVAVAEIQGVTSADAVIVLLPGGKGTHTELGAALASGKPVFLWSLTPEDLNEIRFGKPHTCVFYHHPNVLKCHGEWGLVCIIVELVKRCFTS